MTGPIYWHVQSRGHKQTYYRTSLLLLQCLVVAMIMIVKAATRRIAYDRRCAHTLNFALTHNSTIPLITSGKP